MLNFVIQAHFGNFSLLFEPLSFCVSGSFLFKFLSLSFRFLASSSNVPTEAIWLIKQQKEYKD